MANKVHIKTPASVINRALFVLLLLAIVYISSIISPETDLRDRKILIAYCTLFATAVFATSLPSALIPSPSLALNQLLNTSPALLFRSELRRWMPIVTGLLLPPAIVALNEPANLGSDLPEKLVYMASSQFTIAAMGLYSFMHYYKIGPKSQSWQEGTSGKTWDKLVEINPTLRPSIPRGLLPALSATTNVFTIGVLATAGGLILERNLGLTATLIPGALLLGWMMIKARSLSSVFDRYYYHTNAFYDEVFRRGAVRVSERAPVSYEAVYWVPPKWRAHTWMSLVQFDRVFPVGRFMTIALLVYWILSLQHPPGTLVNTIYLLLVICTKNLTIFTITNKRLAPNLIEATFQSKAGWSMTRFFVNLRWTLPLLIMLCIVAWLTAGFTYLNALQWVLLDVAMSFLFAWIVTYATFKYQRPGLAA